MFEVCNKVCQINSFQAIKSPAFDQAIPAELLFSRVSRLLLILSGFEMIQCFIVFHLKCLNYFDEQDVKYFKATL